MEIVKPELFTAVFENLLMSGQSFFFIQTHIMVLLSWTNELHLNCNMTIFFGGIIYIVYILAIYYQLSSFPPAISTC